MKKYILTALVTMLITVQVLNGQSARRAICNLLGYTDSFGSLAVVARAAQPPNSARRAIGNLLGRTDAQGALYVVLSGTSSVSSLLFADGSAPLPAISWISEPTSGFYRLSAGTTAFSSLGVGYITFADNTYLRSSSQFGWASGAVGTPADIILARDGADTLAQRRGTNAQTIRIYNTYTDASNYERVALGWATNIFNLDFQKLGTGASRSIAIGVNGGQQFGITTAGIVQLFSNLNFGSDNTYDIGAVGASRPRNIFVGNNVTIAAAAAAGTFTLGSKPFSINTAPTISSGFGTSPSVAANNGTATFTVTVGTGGTAFSGVVTMPAATTGWNCSVNDLSVGAGGGAHTSMTTWQSATTTTSVTVVNFDPTMALVAWTAGDSLRFNCAGY